MFQIGWMWGHHSGHMIQPVVLQESVHQQHVGLQNDKKNRTLIQQFLQRLHQSDQSACFARTCFLIIIIFFCKTEEIIALAVRWPDYVIVQPAKNEAKNNPIIINVWLRFFFSLLYFYVLVFFVLITISREIHRHAK